jgi:hypothetical protein
MSVPSNIERSAGRPTAGIGGDAVDAGLPAARRQPEARRVSPRPQSLSRWRPCGPRSRPASRCLWGFSPEPPFRGGNVSARCAERPSARRGAAWVRRHDCCVGVDTEHPPRIGTPGVEPGSASYKEAARPLSYAPRAGHQKRPRRPLKDRRGRFKKAICGSVTLSQILLRRMAPDSSCRLSTAATQTRGRSRRTGSRPVRVPVGMRV